MTQAESSDIALCRHVEVGSASSAVRASPTGDNGDSPFFEALPRLIPPWFPPTLGLPSFKYGATPMKSVTILALSLLLLGCGPQSNREAQKSSTKKPAAGRQTKSKPVAKPKPTLTVEADSFAGIPEAIEALAEAAKSGKKDEMIQADKWLEMQGQAALEPLANVVTDEQAHLAPRIAACRVLRRLGPNAKPALKQALGSESQQMRLNAIESLSLVRPTDKDIIQTLMGLVDGEDERARLHAIQALARIGPQAEDMCADKLVTILNDEKENEAIRDAAKRALKKVNPRRTFTD